MERRRLIGVGVLVAMAGAATAAYLLQRASERRGVAAAWSEFAACSVGRSPLDGEAPADRLRRIDIGISQRVDAGAPPPRGESWRCISAARKLEAAWTRAVGPAEAERSDVDESLRTLQDELYKRPMPLGKAGRDALDRLFQAFGDVPTEPSSTELSAPAPVAVPQLGPAHRLGPPDRLAERQPVITDSLRFRLHGGSGAWQVPGGSDSRVRWSRQAAPGSDQQVEPLELPGLAQPELEGPQAWRVAGHVVWLELTEEEPEPGVAAAPLEARAALVQAALVRAAAPEALAPVVPWGSKGCVSRHQPSALASTEGRSPTA
ncbi:MAG: hypothetical protein R3B89_06365 [Polyangiaceae bacterium]